jgi:N-methylhydantoinase A
MPLASDAAVEALAKPAGDIGASISDTAAGIYEVVNQNMAAAARMHAVERGIDLRGVPILAFGGAGPVHACGVAELLDSSRVIFPTRASVLSAFGTLVSPVRIDLARTLVRELGTVEADERDVLLREMCDEGRQVLADAGVPADEVRFRFGIDARYRGQAHELTIWVGEGDRWPATNEETMRLYTD